MSRKRAIARVVVTLEIHVDGAWGEDCTIGQINSQASKEAIDAIRRGLIIDGLVNTSARINATNEGHNLKGGTLLKDPIVEMVIVKER